MWTSVLGRFSPAHTSIGRLLCTGICIHLSIHPESDPGTRIPPLLLVDGNLFRALSSSWTEPQQFMCFWNTFVSFALSASNYDVSHEPTRPWLILIPSLGYYDKCMFGESVYTAYACNIIICRRQIAIVLQRATNIQLYYFDSGRLLIFGDGGLAMEL